MAPNPNTYIFIDESGKPEVFSSKDVNLVSKGMASGYLILAAVRSHNQLELQQKITDFKADLLRDPVLKQRFSTAYTLDAFHAHHDYDEVKERFYAFISTLDIKLDVIVAEKLKCYEPLQQNPSKMHGVMAGQLLKTICHQTESAEIVFSRKDSKLKLRQELEIEVERIRLDYIEKHPALGENATFKLKYFHNPHYSHGGLQVADYVAYAIYQVFERENMQWYKIIQKKIGKIQDICNQKFYTRNNPLELSS